MEKYLTCDPLTVAPWRASRFWTGNAWGCRPKSHEEPPQLETMKNRSFNFNSFSSQDEARDNEKVAIVANKLIWESCTRDEECPQQVQWWVATCRNCTLSWGYSNTEMGRAARAISVKFPDLSELREVSLSISLPKLSNNIKIIICWVIQIDIVG